MMKYIRTKDGVFEIREWTDNEYIVKNAYPVYANKVNPLQSSVRYKDILVQADTIEELCDEFVGIKENGKPIVQSSYTKLKPSLYILKNDLDIKEIYGAIWTDKGLIYVAKMNEKGELELL